MAEKLSWHYEKLDENGKVKWAPQNDADGKITGRHVFGLKAWFDENPEERKRLGWIKHIQHKAKDVEYNRATQYIVNAVKNVDEWTVEDNWVVVDLSEEQMRLREVGIRGDWDFVDSDSDVLVWGA